VDASDKRELASTLGVYINKARAYQGDPASSLAPRFTARTENVQTHHEEVIKHGSEVNSVICLMIAGRCGWIESLRALAAKMHLL
jgi:hypothetical protein